MSALGTWKFTDSWRNARLFEHELAESLAAGTLKTACH
jgi:hypothetical protein